MDAIATLAGGIAHDYNNLLYIIMGNLSIAEESISEHSEVFQFLKNAQLACNRTKELTSQLVTFAKGGAPVKKIGSITNIVKEIPLNHEATYSNYLSTFFIEYLRFFSKRITTHH